MKRRVPWGTVVPPWIRSTPFALKLGIHVSLQGVLYLYSLGSMNLFITQPRPPDFHSAGPSLAAGEGDVAAPDGRELLSLCDGLWVDVADDEVVEEGAAQEGLGDHSHMTSALRLRGREGGWAQAL